jgi:hypothetical protein
MPRTSMYLVRTSLIWLGIGGLIGGLMLINKGIPFWPMLWAWRWAHVHSLLIGWMLQVACGVATWMLPRPQISGWRGDQRLIWACYLSLNLGVICAVLPGSATVLGGGQALNQLYLITGICYLCAMLAWVLAIWPRLIPSLRELQ